MKKIKKEINEEKEKMQILWMIFIIPIIFFILDITNIGHIFFPYIDNLNSKYDWLSFIGTYSGAIVSAIFLIFITVYGISDNRVSDILCMNSYLMRSPRLQGKLHKSVLFVAFQDFKMSYGASAVVFNRHHRAIFVASAYKRVNNTAIVFNDTLD